MAVIKAKPTSPGRRGVIYIKSDLYKGRPHKALLEKKIKKWGQKQ
jgi:large subunit ribosomal protein L2